MPECKIMFLNTTVSIDGFGNPCFYIDYHITILTLCGTSTVLTLLVICMCLICKAERETLENGIGVAGSCCGLSILGFEGPFVLLVLLINLIIIYAIMACHWRMLRSLCALLFARRVAVVPLSGIVVENPLIVLDQPSALILLDQPSAPPHQECSVCLDIEGLGWAKTECGHTFHTACLRKWVAGKRRATCPNCRTSLNYSTQCPICFELGDTSDPGWARTLCGHTFHTACLGQWTAESRSCPVCMADLGYGGN